tara:strand:+ start:4639 stop:5391 length:753 start_codon:yes stop_codon:yes gene_type:complete
VGNLEVYWTADGSPSLTFEKILQGPEKNSQEGYVEKMHHSQGAWSETKYIYQTALERALSQAPKELRVLSLGLGLGYNEVMSAGLELSQPQTQMEIFSFESLPELQKNFLDYLGKGSSELFSECYEWIFENLSAEFDLRSDELRKHCLQKYESGKLHLLNAFPESLPKNQTYEVILYDAFSNKMNPELWTEDFLQGTLSEIASSDCILTTYAATGALKRSLKSLGFSKLERPGFAGKRDSSFYVRGVFAE